MSSSPSFCGICDVRHISTPSYHDTHRGVSEVAVACFGH
jgi:hypothetical protein